MKKAFSALLFLTSLQLSAQTADELIGFWKYHGPQNPQEVDSTGKAMLKRFFGSMSIDLNEDGHYTLSMMGREDEGKWTFDATQEEELELLSDNGSGKRIDIIEVDNKRLVLQLDGKGFEMRKADKSTNTGTSRADEVKGTEAAPEQLIKTWYLVKRDRPGKKSSAITAKMLAGSYVQLNEDGSYSVKMLGAEDSGSWKLKNKNTQLVWETGNEKKVWTIRSVSDNELILARGNSKETWYFSAEKPDVD